jgi:hypothetical protein
VRLADSCAPLSVILILARSKNYTTTFAIEREQHCFPVDFLQVKFKHCRHHYCTASSESEFAYRYFKIFIFILIIMCCSHCAADSHYPLYIFISNLHVVVMVSRSVFPPLIGSNPADMDESQHYSTNVQSYDSIAFQRIKLQSARA